LFGFFLSIENAKTLQDFKVGRRWAALFVKMLEIKYGSLPQWTQDKIAAANANTIEQWAAKLRYLLKFIYRGAI
jgi:hypothetical protein